MKNKSEIREKLQELENEYDSIIENKGNLLSTKEVKSYPNSLSNDEAEEYHWQMVQNLNKQNILHWVLGGEDDGK